MYVITNKMLKKKCNNCIGCQLSYKLQVFIFMECVSYRSIPLIEHYKFKFHLFQFKKKTLTWHKKKEFILFYFLLFIFRNIVKVTYFFLIIKYIILYFQLEFVFYYRLRCCHSSYHNMLFLYITLFYVIVSK